MVEWVYILACTDRFRVSKCAVCQVWGSACSQTTTTAVKAYLCRVFAVYIDRDDGERPRFGLIIEIGVTNRVGMNLKTKFVYRD